MVAYLVVAARLLLPLAIPLSPLYGILACMFLDAADQSLLQAFGVDFSSYQYYDKALDTYYLAIAYLATMRNWENVTAIGVARALFYYRLIGATAFELSGVRPLLAAFPNAFEPFFVYYELVRRRGDPMLLTRNMMLLVVGVIWFVFKLPHEWWIHIAKVDATDFLKTKILGAQLDTPLWRAIGEAPVVTGSFLLGTAVAVLLVRRYRKRRRPRPSLVSRVLVEAQGKWGARLHSLLAHWNPQGGRGNPQWERGAGGTAGSAGQSQSEPLSLGVAIHRARNLRNLRLRVVGEKAVLVGLISVIFHQTLPDLGASGVDTAIFVTVAITASDFCLRWALRRYGIPLSLVADVMIIAGINFAVCMVFQYVVPFLSLGPNLLSALVFASLITLFVTLFDHYRPMYDLRRFVAKH